jgi:hypothetical protein
MSPLEIALVILVSVWSLIFIIMAVAMIVLLLGLKKAIDKINNILGQGEDVAQGLGAIGKVAATGASGLLLKMVGNQVKNVLVRKSVKKRR